MAKAAKKTPAKKSVDKPVPATMRTLSGAEVKAFATALSALPAEVVRTKTELSEIGNAADAVRAKTADPISAASSLAGRVLQEQIDQAMWNRVRNDEQAFYAFAKERLTLAAACLGHKD